MDRLAQGLQRPSQRLKAHRYVVAEADSPWRLINPEDRRLIGELAPGFAGAVRETKTVDAAAIDAWLKISRTGAHVGHTDTLAVPG